MQSQLGGFSQPQTNIEEEIVLDKFPEDNIRHRRRYEN